MVKKFLLAILLALCILCCSSITEAGYRYIWSCPGYSFWIDKDSISIEENKVLFDILSIDRKKDLSEVNRYMFFETKDDWFFAVPGKEETIVPIEAYEGVWWQMHAFYYLMAQQYIK